MPALLALELGVCPARSEAAEKRLERPETNSAFVSSGTGRDLEIE
jgi:hypothetical protein